MAKLDNTEFLSVVSNTPLIALDLILHDEQDCYLLGRRVNRPARGVWFVPGGRVRKDERLDDAFARLTQEELGLHGVDRSEAELIGVYEHFYDDNFSGKDGISTHYVVLGYRIRLTQRLAHLPLDQHSDYRWASAEDIALDESVHHNSRAYFVTGS
ncbi:GDP-mannose mannosyl hydrolase [Paraburkholderia rhizosphaerae]|uniref:Colanic acid biosynthesis protein WcaH n=1 Tax=Paraburkholderia rhizosphaerae TaxID=480658 RepID=A0A4V3HDC3_9BURK|nr:GDP-mannose mannosyl hydrolase [Paraburkholderia rhizosphaerae]TDY40514.1 colanic acid biosynthesis protein WcaH [Paraburkholderia rhizosphaerae]